jgi:hypothetical protein
MCRSAERYRPNETPKGFRQRGVFAVIQAAVDTDLLAAGIIAIRSWVVDGPGAAAVGAAIVARGGTKVRERLMHRLICGGFVRVHAVGLVCAEWAS